jgi:hypothetical protein
MGFIGFAKLSRNRLVGCTSKCPLESNSIQNELYASFSDHFQRFKSHSEQNMDLGVWNRNIGNSREEIEE